MTTKTKKVHENLDGIGGPELRNFAIQTLAADPSTTYPRKIYNSVLGKYRRWIGPTGTDWEDDGGSSLAAIAAGSVLANNTGGSAVPTAVDIDTTFKTALALVKGDVGLGNVSNVDQIPLSYLDIDGTLAANSDTKVASQKAVNTKINALLAASDAFVFKGVIDCSANPNYPAADAGWTYKVSVAGKIGGASGINVEVGDTLQCLVDSTASGNQATVGANWNITQVNLDGAVIGPASAADSDFVLFNGTTGKIIKVGSVASVKTLLGITGTEVRKFSTTIGDSTTADIVVTHSLGTRDIQVQVWDAATPWSLHDVYCEATSTTTCTLFFPTAPATNELRVVVTA